MTSPKTPEEWQAAVDVAAAVRAIADCMMYGLLEGPSIQVARCDRLLARGKRLGFTPSRPATDLAAAFVASYNAELAKRD